MNRPSIGDGQGYETGGLLFFDFGGKEMVAVVRERTTFDKHLRGGTSLQEYCDTAVTDEEYGAVSKIAGLLPRRTTK